MNPGAFRLLLAIAVLISHISRFEVGRIAVLLFFFLSGYWVTRIWSTKFDSRHSIQFYGSRYFRIVPLYLLVMFAAAVALDTPIHFENLTLLGVASTERDPTGVSWSLDIELQFYILTPLIAAFCLRFSPLYTLLCSTVLGALGWIAHWHFGISSVMQYLPVFQLGALTSLFNFAPSQRVSVFSLLAFAALTLSFIVWPAAAAHIDKTKPNLIDQDIFAFLWLLPLLPYVAYSLTLKSSKLDRHLGNLSYPLYLVHYPLIELATRVAGDGHLVKYTAAAASIVFAVILYAFVDRPIDALRTRVFERRATA